MHRGGLINLFVWLVCTLFHSPESNYKQHNDNGNIVVFGPRRKENPRKQERERESTEDDVPNEARIQPSFCASVFCVVSISLSQSSRSNVGNWRSFDVRPQPSFSSLECRLPVAGCSRTDYDRKGQKNSPGKCSQHLSSSISAGRRCVDGKTLSS